MGERPATGEGKETGRLQGGVGGGDGKKAVNYRNHVPVFRDDQKQPFDRRVPDGERQTIPHKMKKPSNLRKDQAPSRGEKKCVCP